jgi:glycosyltransferase involved in cell wall biosynthesis
MKIIHLLNHSYQGKWPPSQELHRVDTFSRRYALRIREYSDQYQLECWKPERMISEPITVKEDGITYRIFPASKSSFPYKHFSSSMLKVVREECQRENCLLFLHGIHGKWTNLIPLLVKNVPIIAQHHGEEVTYRIKKSVSKPWRFILALLENEAYKKVDHFFMLYPEAGDKLSKHVSKDRISLQTIGIDFNTFKPYPRKEARKKLKLMQEKRYLLYVGMFENRKGTELLIESLPPIFSKYPEVEFLFIGKCAKTEYLERLHDTIRHLGIGDRIQFMGVIKNEDLPLFYSAADLFVLPSIKGEGLPTVLIEAAACNLPFIATSIRGIPYFAEEAGGGILIEPGSSPAITQAIDGYLSRPPLKINLRENARKHDWDVILKTTFELVEKLENKYYLKPLFDVI